MESCYLEITYFLLAYITCLKKRWIIWMEKVKLEGKMHGIVCIYIL